MKTPGFSVHDVYSVYLSIVVQIDDDVGHQIKSMWCFTHFLGMKRPIHAFCLRLSRQQSRLIECEMMTVIPRTDLIGSMFRDPDARFFAGNRKKACLNTND